MKIRPTFAVMFAFSTLLSTVFSLVSAYAQESYKERVIKKMIQANEPIEVTQVKVKGQHIGFGQAFGADNDWVRDLTVEIRNISDRDIIYVELYLNLPMNDFPPPNPNRRAYLVPLEYGQQPQAQDELTTDTKPLRPGDSATLSVQSWIPETMKRTFREKGSGKALNMDSADLYVHYVYFDRNTKWALGNILRRDPVDKKKWVRIINPTSVGILRNNHKPMYVKASSKTRSLTLHGHCWSSAQGEYLCCGSERNYTYANRDRQISGYYKEWQCLPCWEPCGVFCFEGVKPGCSEFDIE